MANQYYKENIKIKRVLDDIVENAYAGSDKLKAYKGFYFVLSDKNVKSKAGHYKPSDKCITVFGLDRNSKYIVITCIHELAHHIDHVNRNRSDHGEEFYKIYRQLLYTALNMRIFRPEDATMEDVSDSSKIKRMIADWRPSYINYKNDLYIFSVSNCYDQREVLKSRGYQWNNLSRTWDKELAADEIEDEKEYLYEIGLDDNHVAVSSASDVNIKPKATIYTKGGYEKREELKELGFYYKDKEWHKSLDKEADISDEIAKYKRLLPELDFKYKV